MADLTISSLRGVSREQLAWASGLFEGEGSFTVQNRGKYVSIVAELAMTDEDRVRQFHSIIGVGNVTKHTNPIKDYYKPVFTWKTGSFEGVQSVIAALWFWLGPRRKARAKEILAIYHNGTHVRRFALALPAEVIRVKSLLLDGVSKRKIAQMVGRSYGFVNHIKQGRTHGEASHG